MTDWALTLGLQNLRSQVNAAFPGRSKASDGTIGDAAHMAETSGHNPDDTAGSRAEYNDGDGKAEVRAWDCTSNFGPGAPSAQVVVDHLRALPGLSSVLRYMIYNRKIYEASNDWIPRTYTGSSPHTEHIHFSGARTQAADNNTTFDYHLEDLVSITDADVDKIWGKVLDNPYTAEADTTTAGGYLRYAPSLTGIVNGIDTKLAARFAALAAAIGVDDVDEQAIIAGVVAGIDAPGLAASIAAAVNAELPDGVEVSPEQLQAAIVGALRELAAPAESPAA